MAQGQRNRLRDQRKRRSRTATGIDGSAGAGEWMAGDDRQRRPAEGLVGAHDQRRDTLIDGPAAGWLEQDRDDARFTAGAEVAPTARAARDQRARHRTERSSGRIAARIPGKKAAARPAARGATGSKRPLKATKTAKPAGPRRGRAPTGPAAISRRASATAKKRGRDAR
jgi:hypothetical protein